MDWSVVISRQKAALLAVVNRMWAMAGAPISPHAAEKAKSTSWASECEDQVSDFASEGIVCRDKKSPLLPFPMTCLASPSQDKEKAFSPARGEIGRSASWPLPRLLALAILRILRPAESAARRLIVIVAEGLVLKTNAGKAEGRSLPDFSSFAKSRGPRPPAFRLFDTPWVMVPRAFGQGRRAVPRVRVFGEGRLGVSISPLAGEKAKSTSWASECEDQVSDFAREGIVCSDKTIPSLAISNVWPPHSLGQAIEIAFSPARGEIGCSALHRRIAALHHALNTLPRQAHRLKRIMAARQKAVVEKAAKGLTPGSTKNPLPLGPMRPGRPPGHITRPRNEADLILKDCQDLALYRTRVPQPPP